MTSSGDDLLEFIFCWIDQHLTNCDMQYGKFYQESKREHLMAVLSVLNSQSLKLIAT